MKRVVRVGLADSGINPRHRHVGRVAGGVGINVTDGRVEEDGDWLDQLGHGTAAAATITGHAPDAELYAIRIFRRRLEAHAEALLRAIEWATAKELDVLNLSLGCSDGTYREAFASACARAIDDGMLIVSAARAAGERSLPGSLPGVVAVDSDPELDDAATRVDGGVVIASPWARALGPLPKERNFHGVSLAIAHVSGLAAARLATGVSMDSDRLRAALRTLGTSLR